MGKTMYSAGADGISMYNHFCSMWNAPFFPQMLGVFHDLRDVERFSRGERCYVFDPRWGGLTGFGPNRRSTGAIKANRVVLDRAAAKASGEYCFNLYEDLSLAHTATLLFRGFGMTEEDGLEVKMNGHLIPSSSMWQSKETDAPPTDWHHVRKAGGKLLKCIQEQGRIDFRPEKEPACSARWFSLSPSVVAYGENRLGLTLTRSDQQARSPSITIDELEVTVFPR